MKIVRRLLWKMVVGAIVGAIQGIGVVVSASLVLTPAFWTHTIFIFVAILAVLNLVFSVGRWVNTKLDPE